MAASDCLDLKEVSDFVSICSLAITHFSTIRVVSIGAYKIRGSGHVTLNCPLYGLDSSVGRVIRFSNDVELASFVLVQVVHGFSPRAVHLAYRRVAELDLDGLVG